MDWPLACLLLWGSLLVFMTTGMPVAFAFMLSCAVGAFVFWGGFIGLEELAISIFSSITRFEFVPLALFTLMGTIIFESGIGARLVKTLNDLIGRVPGRLSIISVAAGTLLAVLTGSSTATVAILSKSLIPQMQQYKYDKTMMLGPILASGNLAPMIPPSSLTIFLAAVAGISVSKLLIATIVPGLVMAGLYSVYIIIRCSVNPSLAPSYRVPPVPIKEKIRVVSYNILPLGIVIFAVIGVMLAGIATPSEASGSGVIACYLMALLYRNLNWKVVKDSAISAVQMTVMILMIIAAAATLSKLLSFSGAVTGLVKVAYSLPVSPMTIIIASQVLVLFLGMFMGPPSIMLVTMPVYMPVLGSLGFDPVWFGTMMLITTELSLITPPVGMNSYLMASLAPKGMTVGDVFNSSMPFLGLSILTVVLVMLFPQIALWMPGMLK